MDLGLPPKPSRESLVAMCRDEPEEAADLILLLWEKVETLTATVEKQGAKIASLEAKLAKNSSNSSKPPSSDKHNPGSKPDRRARSGTRKNTTRKPGGQPGHEGSTLKKSSSPDHVIDLPPPKICTCGESLSGQEPCGRQQRQVFDLPPEIKIEVTEYNAPVCKCPACGKKNVAAFPGEAAAPVQYGKRVRATSTSTTYFHTKGSRAPSAISSGVRSRQAVYRVL